MRRGSAEIEFVLWLVMMLPGLIYSIWRSSGDNSVCQHCGSRSMVPVNSLTARHTLKTMGVDPKKALAEAIIEDKRTTGIAKKPAQRNSRQTLWVVAIVLLVFVSFILRGLPGLLFVIGATALAGICWRVWPSDPSTTDTTNTTS